MLTIFHGTARPLSNSRKIANFYHELLGERNVPHQFFTLEGLEQSVFSKTYHNEKSPEQAHVEQEILAPTKKFIFIVPEYNGSFPGMFKAFIDSTDVPSCFHNKKACLTGVAEGRAGNLRGIEHLTNIFNHIKMDVLHFKIPISQVHLSLDENGKLNNPEMIKLINIQIDLFLKF